jgi:TRAP-type C4-dicarboxylate transport system permease small subunit
MRLLSKIITHSLNVLMVISLAGMGILVFLNVVLRYVFNSGITFSDEMSVYFFVWLTLLGAIGAMRSNQHLGMDSVVKRMPRPVKIVFYLIGNGLMLYILWLIFNGSMKLVQLNWHVKSTAVGLPLAWVYGTGVVMSVSMALIIILNTIRLFMLFRNKEFIDLLISKPESEEEITVQDH